MSEIFGGKEEKIGAKNIKNNLKNSVTMTEGKINLETGCFTIEDFENKLNILPIDIILVNKDDIVAYFSQTKGRIFTRTKAVIGSKIQECCPQKSVHIVNQILEDFKNKKKRFCRFLDQYRGILNLYQKDNWRKKSILS